MIDVTVAVDPTVTGSGADPSSIDIPVPDASDFTIYITDADGNRAIWTGFTSSGGPERLLPGIYELTAISGVVGREGFDQPCFFASGKVMVENGKTTPVTLTATLANALVEVIFSESLNEKFDGVTATLHSTRAGYYQYSSTDSGPLFLSPGDINLSLDITLRDGRQTSFTLLTIPEAKAATYYNVELSASEEGEWPVITASVSTGMHASRILDDDFVAGKAPVIIPEGYESAIPIQLAEGASPDAPTIARVNGNNIEHLYLTVIAPSLGSALNAEVDLLDLKKEEADSLHEFDLIVRNLHKGNMTDGEVDFSRLISRIKYVEGAIPSTFSLRAVDAAGRVSSPVVLAVRLLPVEIAIAKVSDAIVGVNVAQIELSSSSPYLEGNIAIETLSSTTGQWTPVKIESIDTIGYFRSLVTFEVPDGIDAITARLIFCGRETKMFTIERSLPAYTLSADPFAHHVNIRVSAEDPEMTSIVTSVIHFYDSKGNRMLLVERFPAEGLIIISGLSSDEYYNLRSGLGTSAPHDDEKETSVVFRTETVQQLPNSDFESVLYKDFRYDRMPSGGRYSQNSVAIFNRQNHTSFDLLLPEEWTTVNAKTFCRQASNHNTWYMAPSTYVVTDAYSGAYAVRIDCVGYDINGAPIPDYLQTSKPYTEYSLNVPSGYDRATGRLFLGEYAFDASSKTETYDMGIPFKSRPSTLNGAYKFSPSPANPRASGLGRIEVLGYQNGVEVVIASASISLAPVMSYTLFSMPLTYRYENVKASSIRILFAASEAIGDIESETQNITVTPFPETSTLRGSSLWIDNISLGY